MRCRTICKRYNKQTMRHRKSTRAPRSYMAFFSKVSLVSETTIFVKTIMNNMNNVARALKISLYHFL